MDYSDVSTVQLPVTRVDPAPRRGRGWRELSGALAVGMSVLALVVVALQVLAWVRDMPGPGALMVVGHLAVAVLAVVAQRFVDRRRGWASAAAVLTVFAVAAAGLWFFWWA